MIVGVLLALTCVVFAGGFRIVCHYTNAANNRMDSAKFIPENIIPQMCTHIVFNVAQPSGLDIGPTHSEDLPHRNRHGLYARMLQLKLKSPLVKVLLAMANPLSEQDPYAAILATAESRSVFATNAIKYLRLHHFDGLVISWKNPDDFGIPVIDKGKFVSLFKELNHQFKADKHRPKLLLCAVLPGIRNNIDGGYNMRGILQYADFISLLTYNYHYNNNNTVQLISPLHSPSDDHLSLDATVEYIIEKDFPKDKIDIGITLGARTYRLEDPNEFNIGAKSVGNGNPGFGTLRYGQMGFYEICGIIKNGGVVIADESQHARYVVLGKFWASYEDVHTILAKTCYAKDNQFGGVMISSLDLDDFNGTFCTQGKYPLLKATSWVRHTTNCRIFTPAKHASGGHSQLNYSVDVRFSLVLVSLLGLCFSLH